MGKIYSACREGDPEGWFTVLVTALGSWEKMVPRGHLGLKNYAAQSELVSTLKAESQASQALGPCP